MVKEILKTVLGGILAGVALFMLPFIVVKILFILLLLKISFHLVGCGRHRICHSHHFHHMSNEQREAFKAKYGKHCGNSTSEEPTKQE